MKVLLVHASLGWGHQRAAEALQGALRQNGVESEVHDLMRFLPRPMNEFYPWSYEFMVTQGRWLWRLLYHCNDWPRWPYSPARSLLQNWQFTAFYEYVSKENFTHIISTHFASSALLLDWRNDNGIRYKLFTIITDFTAHRCWKRKGIDHYFVPCDRVATQLVAYGVPSSAITVSGIPISPSFLPALTREEARKKYDCKPDQTVILVLTSGLNLRKTCHLLEDLKQVPGNVRYLVSAGKLPEREERLRKTCDSDPRFYIFGFSNHIAEMMRASDLLITKPGGLSVSEALGCGLPAILFSPIPGHEEANAKFVVDHGAGLCIEAKRGAFLKALQTTLTSDGRLSSMKTAAIKLGKPHAAHEIANSILNQR